MKILSAENIKELDNYTIEHEPISSINLMERAARAFADAFMAKYDNSFLVYIICGIGNNGGDGLAVSRILHQNSYDIKPIVIGQLERAKVDFLYNYQRLIAQNDIENITDVIDFNIHKKDHVVIIDAIFGSGLNRKVEGISADFIHKINHMNFPVVSMDIASGLRADRPSDKSTIIKPDYTITFQSPKLAFFMPENEEFIGEFEIVDIRLHKEFEARIPSDFYYTTQHEILINKRSRFTNKGTYGSAALYAGCVGMMGAAILASKGCLRTGAGKLSLFSAKTESAIMQTAVPEVIFVDDDIPLNPENYEAIGIGPGLGMTERALKNLKQVLQKVGNRPLVIDADGLNLLDDELLAQLPKNTILTPHPKEFKKLVNQTWENDFEKLQILIDFAKKHQVIICLKGFNTAVALPNGQVHFNSTGNAGMATAGSGDVLTGIILGFLAQGYSPERAAIDGVFEHGKAGDLAASKRSQRAIIASDIIENIR